MRAPYDDVSITSVTSSVVCAEKPNVKLVEEDAARHRGKRAQEAWRDDRAHRLLEHGGRAGAV